MLREVFIGHKPSQFSDSTIIQAFFISEMFLWSAWNFFTPIFALFAAQINKSGVEVAASSFSAYLISRVVFELISGKYLNKVSEFQQFMITICGMCLLTASYIGFAFTSTVWQVFAYYILIGIGLGIATPARMALFSVHLDRNKAAEEWGIHDAIVFIGMALAGSLGGFIVQRYGFPFLFLLSAFINTIGILPYLLYVHHRHS